MKAKEIVKYMAYADNNEDYVVLTRKNYNKITRLAKKYMQIKKITLDKSQHI